RKDSYWGPAPTRYGVPHDLQLPWTQVSPPAHEVPHAPQCASVVPRSTHEVPHSVCPAVGQAQPPLKQLDGAGQLVPQPPQCWLLVFVLTQVPLHRVCEPPHTQSPPTHDVPPVQP